MHTKYRFFDYGYKMHAQTHHRIFRSDQSYHAQHMEDMQTIHMVRWAPLIIFGGSLPYFLVLVILSILNFEHTWIILITGVCVSIAYYLTYEYLHWCMHLPKRRRLEKSRLFQRLNGHHLLHHRYMERNFNVVFPLADWCLGTLLKRSPKPFMQARGDAVPDVQPL